MAHRKSRSKLCCVLSLSPIEHDVSPEDAVRVPVQGSRFASSQLQSRGCPAWQKEYKQLQLQSLIFGHTELRNKISNMIEAAGGGHPLEVPNEPLTYCEDIDQREKTVDEWNAWAEDLHKMYIEMSHELEECDRSDAAYASMLILAEGVIDLSHQDQYIVQW